MKRLSDSEVRSIFECLHHGKPPPPNLKFQIVPVGPAGLKLSPPAYEFEGKCCLFASIVEEVHLHRALPFFFV